MRRHAEQHLELVLVATEPAGLDQPQRLGDQLLVVRRDRDVAPLLEQRLEAAHEALAHLVRVLERDRLGLEVDALAEPDVVEARATSSSVRRSRDWSTTPTLSWPAARSSR